MLDERYASADAVHALSLANLNGEFAGVLSTDAILRRVASEGGDA